MLEESLKKWGFKIGEFKKVPKKKLKEDRSQAYGYIFDDEVKKHHRIR